MAWIETHHYNKQSENDEYFFFYDNRIQNESDIITYYGENSDIYYLGFSATVSEKSGNTILQTIKLLPNGNFTLNGETQESDYNNEGLLHIGSIKRVDNNSLGKNFYGNYLGPKNPILLQKQISDNKDKKK